MKIGNKIKKIRELKNITPKDMADRLDITPQSYNKIERDDVTINMDRLLEISEIFGMKPEDIMTFDEKVVFNITNNHQPVTGYIIHHTVSEETKALYDDKIKLMEEQIQLLKEQNQFLKERLKHWEGK